MALKRINKVSNYIDLLSVLPLIAIFPLLSSHLLVAYLIANAIILSKTGIEGSRTRPTVVVLGWTRR
jgi:hypothetical protein